MVSVASNIGLHNKIESINFVGHQDDQIAP